MTISGEMILGPVKVKPRGPSNKLHSAILTGFIPHRTIFTIPFQEILSILSGILSDFHSLALENTITQLYCNHHSCSCCLVVLLIKIDFIGGGMCPVSVHVSHCLSVLHSMSLFCNRDEHILSLMNNNNNKTTKQRHVAVVLSTK